jgi:hypothetical protein
MEELLRVWQEKQVAETTINAHSTTERNGNRSVDEDVVVENLVS